MFFLGDRWLVSCLGVLFSLKNLFYRVVPADQNIENCHGVFRFRLWWCGEWVEASNSCFSLVIYAVQSTALFVERFIFHFITSV